MLPLTCLENSINLLNNFLNNWNFYFTYHEKIIEISHGATTSCRVLKKLTANTRLEWDEEQKALETALMRSCKHYQHEKHPSTCQCSAFSIASSLRSLKSHRANLTSSQTADNIVATHSRTLFSYSLTLHTEYLRISKYFSSRTMRDTEWMPA